MDFHLGASIGLITAFAGTRLIKSLLNGVGATDPLTFTVVLVMLVAVALLAFLIPARARRSGSDDRATI